jgi:hypothetical protein
VVEVFVGPGRGLGRPRAFEAARDGEVGVAGSERILPAEALLFHARAFGFRADVVRGIRRAVDLAERVAAGDEGDRFFVVHGHPAERLANIVRRCERIRLAFGAFRIHVDQAHLNRRERVLEFALAALAQIAAEPRRLVAPVDVFFGLPDVDASAAEAERFEAHRFEGAVAGEDEEVGPGEFVAVLLLDRPE